MALTDPAVILSAVASGAAVVAVTWLADRIGGTLGGLLATAPITTAAAFLYLSLQLGNGPVGLGALQGGKSLFAAIAAMPAYFYVQKWLSDPIPLPVRIIGGIALYVGVFTLGTLAADAITTPGYAWVWSAATLVLVAGFTRTYLVEQIPPRLLRGEPAPPRLADHALRFLAGAGVILLVTALRDADPLLTTAWAVFPGTFLVTLAVLGLRNGAAFSARAAQGGALGGPPLVAYLVVLRLLLPLHDGMGWAALVQIPAWCAYLLVMWPLWRWQKGRRGERAAHRPVPSAPGAV